MRFEKPELTNPLKLVAALLAGAGSDGNQRKEKIPLLQPKLRLPLRALQTLAAL